MRDGFRIFRHPENIQPGKKLPRDKKVSVARGNLHSTFNAGKRTYLKVHLPIISIQETEIHMQELYNCKQIDASHYRITKFDKHLDPKYSPQGNQSSYVVSESGCDCPQGHAHSCRHRKMLPFFIEHEYVDTEYFFVWETHQWFKGPTIAQDARKANGKHEPPKPIKQELDVPELVKAMEAVGIPTVVIDKPTKTYRRF